MKLGWCWRCKRNVPMFDDTEYEILREAHARGAAQVKRARITEKRKLEKEDEEELLRAIEPAYHALTSSTNAIPAHVLKHRISLFGPPCQNCGKELRTPTAKKCLECGWKREV